MRTYIKHTFMAASLAIVVTTGFAQKLDRTKLPADAPAPVIRLANPESFTLANGLRVFVVQNNKLPRVAFNLLLDYEPILEGDKAGYVSIAGELLKTGTKTRTKDQIDEAVDFMGATLNTSPTGIYAASLKKHTNQLLELMADVLLNPNFTQAELDRLKKQNISAIASRKDNPNAIASLVSNAVMYGKNHPYGETETEETVGRVTLADARTFYTTYFRPNIGYLAVVGDITPAEARTLVEKHFSKWQRGDVPKPTYAMPKAPEKTKIVLVDRPSAAQSVIAVVSPAELKPGSPDAIRTSLMNDILGGGATARLFMNLREKHGYTYGANSSLTSDKLIGRFRAGASVRTAVTDSAVAELMHELKAIREGVPTDEELKRTKSIFSGNYVFSLENPQTIANYAIRTAQYGLPADYYANYLKNVEKVTDAEIKQMAQKFIDPSRVYIVVVGKGADIADKLKRFGDIEYYDAQGNKVDAPTPAKAAPVGMNAQQVIDKYIAAVGGKDALTKVKDITVTLNTEIQGQAMEMVRKSMAPNKSSMVATAMGMEVVKMVSDGSKVSMMQMGQGQTLEGKDARQITLTSGTFPELRMAENGVKATLAGTEKVNGKDAYKVVYTTDEGITWTDFFDAESGLRVQQITTQQGPQGAIQVPVSFSNYKEVNGIKFPYTIQQSMGPMQLTLNVKNIEVNKGLKESDFEVK
ncbi:insulinase family protein [Nibrella viscosa]